MNRARNYLYVSAAVFAVVSLIHLIRALAGWPFQIGPIELSLAVSWVGFVATAMLAAWALRLATTQPTQA